MYDPPNPPKNFAVSRVGLGGRARTPRRHVGRRARPFAEVDCRRSFHEAVTKDFYRNVHTRYPTARFVSQLRNGADDRAERPAESLVRGRQRSFRSGSPNGKSGRSCLFVFRSPAKMPAGVRAPGKASSGAGCTRSQTRGCAHV